MAALESLDPLIPCNLLGYGCNPIPILRSAVCGM